MKNIKNIVVVSSGKGGVGKSTIATNLAIALCKKQLKVGLLDADIYGPSIPTLLNIHKKPEISKNKKILPFQKFDIKSISIGNLIPKDKPVIWRGAMVVRALNQLIKDVDWGILDILIIDLPPGTGDVQLSLSQSIRISGAIVVSTPQEVALVDVRRAINMFKRVNVNIIGIIENMSYFMSEGKKVFVFGKNRVKKESSTQKIRLLAQIPLSQDISEYSDKGIPFLIKESNESELNVIFDKLCDEVILSLNKSNEGQTDDVKIEIED